MCVGVDVYDVPPRRFTCPPRSEPSEPSESAAASGSSGSHLHFVRDRCGPRAEPHRRQRLSKVCLHSRAGRGGGGASHGATHDGAHTQKQGEYTMCQNTRIEFPFCPKDTEQVKRLCQSTERYERQRRNLTHTRNAAERQRI